MTLAGLLLAGLAAACGGRDPAGSRRKPGPAPRIVSYPELSLQVSLAEPERLGCPYSSRRYRNSETSRAFIACLEKGLGQKLDCETPEVWHWLGGLRPQAFLLTCRTYQPPYVFVNHERKRRGVRYLLIEGGKLTRLDRPDQVVAAFRPIETKEAALSLAAALHHLFAAYTPPRHERWKPLRDRVDMTHVTPVKDGFRVRLFSSQRLECRQPIRAHDVLVTRDGRVTVEDRGEVFEVEGIRCAEID